MLVEIDRESQGEFRAGSGTVGTDVVRLGCGDAQQTVTVTADGGTFALLVDGAATADLAEDATAAQVKAALEAVVGANNVGVSGNAGGPWTVTFLNARGGQPQSAMTADTSKLTKTATVVVETTVPGAEGTNEQQVVTVDAASGHFTLTFGAATTNSISFDATAAAVQTALEGLAGIGAGNVAVSGAVGGRWTVEFQGDLSAQNVDELVAASVDLATGTPIVAVAVVAPGHDVGWEVKKYVVVRANGANNNIIMVGASEATADDGFILSAGQISPPIYADNLNRVYLKGGAANQGYSYIAC
jgi:5-hydroxyisourate hydrolase-like protein (transthyretin family)